VTIAGRPSVEMGDQDPWRRAAGGNHDAFGELLERDPRPDRTPRHLRAIGRLPGDHTVAGRVRSRLSRAREMKDRTDE